MKEHEAIAILLVVVSITGCVGGITANQGNSTAVSNKKTDTEYPPEPESLSNEAVRSFVRESEKSLRTEIILDGSQGQVQNIEISVNNITITADTGQGAFVHVEYMVGVREAGPSGAVTVSDTRYTANYYVTNGTVWRATTTGIVRPGPDPRTNGTTVPTDDSVHRSVLST